MSARQNSAFPVAAGLDAAAAASSADPQPAAPAAPLADGGRYGGHYSGHYGRRAAAAELPQELIERLRPVRLLCLDVDGVLTDGNLYWSDGGGWSQRFSVRDGFGIKLLQTAGIEVAILSGGDLRAGRARAESLAIRHAFFGIGDKVAVYRGLAEQLGVRPDETAYLGDELVDVPMIELVGFGATVPDAVDEVQDAARYVTRRPGGDGAVRELCDLIRRHARVAVPAR